MADQLEKTTADAVSGEVLDVQAMYSKKPRFKAGSELSGHVNKSKLTVNDQSDEKLIDFTIHLQIELD